MHGILLFFFLTIKLHKTTLIYNELLEFISQAIAAHDNYLHSECSKIKVLKDMNPPLFHFIPIIIRNCSTFFISIIQRQCMHKKIKMNSLSINLSSVSQPTNHSETDNCSNKHLLSICLHDFRYISSPFKRISLLSLIREVIIRSNVCMAVHKCCYFV